MKSFTNSCSLSNCVELNCSDDSESDNDSDNESNDESNDERNDESKPEEVKTLSINTLSPNNVDMTIETEELHNITVTKLEEVEDLETNNDVEVDYNKLSIKQLKDILSKKGINSNNRMKKTDLITLIEKGSGEKVLETLDLKDELSEVNI